jgi:hypothetical protein
VALPVIFKECTEFVQLLSPPHRSLAHQHQVVNAYATAMGKWHGTLMQSAVDLRLGRNSIGLQTEMSPRLAAIFGAGFEERLTA